MSHKLAALWQAAAWSLPTIHTRPFHTISDMLVFHYGHLPRTILLGQLTSLQRTAACRQASGVDDLIYSLPLWNVPIHRFDEFSVTQHHIGTCQKCQKASLSETLQQASTCGGAFCPPPIYSNATIKHSKVQRGQRVLLQHPRFFPFFTLAKHNVATKHTQHPYTELRGKLNCSYWTCGEAPARNPLCYSLKQVFP